MRSTTDLYYVFYSQYMHPIVHCWPVLLYGLYGPCVFWSVDMCWYYYANPKPNPSPISLHSTQNQNPDPINAKAIPLGGCRPRTDLVFFLNVQSHRRGRWQAELPSDSDGNSGGDNVPTTLPFWWDHHAERPNILFGGIPHFALILSLRLVPGVALSAHLSGQIHQPDWIGLYSSNALYMQQHHVEKCIMNLIIKQRASVNKLNSSQNPDLSSLTLFEHLLLAGMCRQVRPVTRHHGIFSGPVNKKLPGHCFKLQTPLAVIISPAGGDRVQC